MKSITSNSKHTIKVWTVIVTLLILSIPLVAMQFTDEVDWDVGDFIIIGGLLIGTGFTYDALAKKIPSETHRIILAIVLLALVFVIWAELAVGIFGSPFAGT